MSATTAEWLSRLPLSKGDRGEGVLDLQLRLAELDLAANDAPGEYGEDTARVVAQFQARRGQRVTGICDGATWRALVEAGYRLGDRLLYRHAPMFRGDDVAELQRRLSALGFDPGRIDGIFGDQSAQALQEFQRNVGLPSDGRLGRETLAQLLTISGRAGGEVLVSPLRERLKLQRGGPGLALRHVAVGEQGGFAIAAAAVCRLLRENGAIVLELHEPSAAVQAARANEADADCFVNLRLLPEGTDCATAYYLGFSYESRSAKRLAAIVQDRLPQALGLPDGGICGMALPILRETRMPAIEVQLGAPSAVVQRIAPLAEVLRLGLSQWFAEGTT